MPTESKHHPPRELPDPVICTVDVVLLTLVENVLQVVLARRAQEPFRGLAALPGGYIHPATDRDARDAAERVLREKTGLQSPYLEQLGVFSGPGRDPRGWSVSVAWYALVPWESLESRWTDHLEVMPAAEVRGLPFDHERIVQEALERVRSKSSYSSLPVHLCREPFTLPQLQAVYEATLGETINKVSFRRKMEELGFVEPIPGAQSGGAHRPAQLYRLRDEYRRNLSITDRGINSGG
ncbi:MAG: NUDIX hydrolase [Fibrobacterota bacterium]|nr:NUDIX hydrolase [Fibrobacterota bacterium]QQS05828.1 MAG: NUDIX hydrolase [Fibrobacterota bacterium]